LTPITVWGYTPTSGYTPIWGYSIPPCGGTVCPKYGGIPISGGIPPIWGIPSLMRVYPPRWRHTRVRIPPYSEGIPTHMEAHPSTGHPLIVRVYPPTRRHTRIRGIPTYGTYAFYGCMFPHAATPPMCGVQSRMGYTTIRRAPSQTGCVSPYVCGHTVPCFSDQARHSRHVGPLAWSVGRPPSVPRQG
jgi:hypothetical protein